MHGRLQQKGRHYFRKKEKETSWAAQGKSLGEEMLQRVRRKPATLIHWTHTETEKELNENRSYLVTVTTELGETETLSVSACNEEKAEELAIDLVERRMVGLRGVFCRSVTVREDKPEKGQ